jgi:hypothetical protein
MNRVVHFVFALFLITGSALAQGRPFESFRKAVDEERGGFSGNKQNLSRVFVAERNRLGEKFEPELWRYLDDDPEKHYWIGTFLTAKSYLHGTEPMPKLAFKVRVRALQLLNDRNDKRSLGWRATINRHLAVYSKLIGKQDEALRYRNAAGPLLVRADLKPFTAGQNPYDACVYANLEGSIVNCAETDTPRETIVNAGWLNSRAATLVEPAYPTEMKGDRSGAKVDVQVVIDKSGNVISAKAFRGPTEFHAAAVDAAMKTKFPPTILSRSPVKVTGWLSFTFKP